MFKVIKIVQTRPNENYTGVIHMAQYINTENEKDRGIMFLSQSFDDEDNVKKTSFFEGKDDCVMLDADSINEDFGVKVSFAYGQGEMISSIEYDGENYFLYDDHIGTVYGQNFPMEDAKFGSKVISDMFRKYDVAKKIVHDDLYDAEYQSLEGLRGKIDSLRETADSLESQYTFMKKKRRESFRRKMDH